VNARSPYLLSTLGHVVVLGVLLSLTTLQRAPQVVTGVRLVALSGGGARGGRAGPPDRPPAPAVVTPAPPPAPKPKPVEKPEKPAAKQPQANVPKPAEARGARPSPDAGMVSKVEPKPAPAKAAGSTAAAVPMPGGSGGTGPAGAAAGPGSGSGVGIEAEGDGGDAPWYWTTLRDKIAGAWRPPAGIGRSGEVRVRVRFVLQPNGDVGSIEVRESSRVGLYDRSAMSAVFDARPFPPLPPELGAEPFGVTLTFHQQY
jgi:TonB family protein